MGFWTNLKERLFSSTGLSSIGPYQPATPENFLSAFSFDNVSQQSQLSRNSREVFETCIEAMRKVANTPSAIKELVSSIGLQVSRIIMPTGQSVSVFKDDKGNHVSGASLGIKSDVAQKVVNIGLTPREERQKAEEMRMAHRVRNEPGSAEHSAFHDFLQPFDYKGRVKGNARYGWNGLSQNINSLPVPDGYGTDAVMDILIRDNTAFVGVSLLKAESSKAETMGLMIEKAIDMGLPMPERKDGKPWSYDSPRDREMASALFGGRSSPFVVGGKPVLSEGTPILMNDNHLVRLNTVSASLTPSALGATMSSIKEAMIKEYTEALENASSPEQKKRAQKDLDAVSRNSNLLSYEDMTTKKHAESIALKERTSQSNVVGMRNNVSYADIRTAVPNWEPSHNNVAFSMEGGTLQVGIYVDDKVARQMNMHVKEKQVKDISGFELEHLKPGNYPVFGTSGFVHVISEDGVKKTLTSGLDKDEQEQEQGLENRQKKEQAHTNRHAFQAGMEMSM